MKLTKKQIDFLVDYYHDLLDGQEPDHDGYIGVVWLDKQVMARYRKKYKLSYEE